MKISNFCIRRPVFTWVLVGIPVVLGSATPSLESLANAAAGRYTKLLLPERTGRAGKPHVGVIATLRGDGRPYTVPVWWLWKDGVVWITGTYSRVWCRQLLRDPLAYHWLLQYPRKTILNHSLHVFEVPAAAR